MGEVGDLALGHNANCESGLEPLLRCSAHAKATPTESSNARNVAIITPSTKSKSSTSGPSTPTAKIVCCHVGAEPRHYHLRVAQEGDLVPLLWR